MSWMRSNATTRPSAIWARARYDYLLGRLQLPAAIGRLTENDVVAVNAYLSEDTEKEPPRSTE
jgi:hypothetical protein